MKEIIILLSILFFFSCQNEKSQNTSKKTVQKEVPQEPKEIEMVAYINNLRVRDAAGTDSKEIARLPENTTIKYKGELSDFTTEIKLRGMKMNAPWLKIETAEGLQGWVYAGGVKPKTNDESKANQIIDNIRIESFFGKKLADQIEEYNNLWMSASTSEAFAEVYNLGNEIQSAANDVLSEKVELDDPQIIPDMSWAERSLQGFQNSLVAEGTQFYLFKNFKIMKAKASQTKGKEDDGFIDLQFQANEIDSIEHFYKSWFIQTWDYGGHSLLGQGKHLSILKKMDQLLAESKLFEKPILELKKNLLGDILDQHVTYWESKEKILDELSSIIQENFVFLSKEDNIALKTRLDMFKNPEANKIEVNKRSY